MFLGMFLSLDLLCGLDFSGSFVHSRRSSCFTFSRFFFIVAFYLCVTEGREITGTYFARYLGWGVRRGAGVLCLDFVSGVWVRVFPLSLSGCGHLPYYIPGSSGANFCLSSPLYSVYFSTSSLSSLVAEFAYVCVYGGRRGEFFSSFLFFLVPSLSLSTVD